MTLPPCCVFLIVLAVFLILIYLYKIFLKNPRHIRLTKTLQGPPGLPIIGNSMDFWDSGVAGMKKLSTYTQRYGHIYKLWFGQHLVIVMSDASNIESILRNSKSLDKPSIFMKSFKRFLGEGLSTCAMSTWKQIRRKVQPLYGKKEFRNYAPQIDDIISKYMQRLETSIDGSEIDIFRKLHEITFNIITKTNFNQEFSTDEYEKLTVNSCNEILSEIGFLCIFRAWLHIPLFFFLRYGRTFFEVKREIRKFTNMLVNSKNEELEEELIKKTENSNMTFLSTIYKMRKENILGDDVMHDQIGFLTIAGTDGIAIVMSYFLLEIAINSSVQLKLQEELDEQFQYDKRPATFEDIERFVYLDQVLKEAERRLTFIPIIMRKLEEDVQIDNHTLPAGSAIFINADRIHNDPRYYPDPNKFNPSNFDPELCKARPGASFLPFSYGPRNCVASHFATGVMKLLLINLLRQFTFSTSMTEEDMNLQVGFITTNQNGYKLNVKLRGT